jgi:hypothetical protein
MAVPPLREWLMVSYESASIRSITATVSVVNGACVAQVPAKA